MFILQVIVEQSSCPPVPLKPSSSLHAILNPFTADQVHLESKNRVSVLLKFLIDGPSALQSPIPLLNVKNLQAIFSCDGPIVKFFFC